MYASVEDVKSITGVSVDATAVKRAQTVIEAYTGKPEADVLHTNDQHRLQIATAYQAAYADSHPELFNMMDVSSFNQGDLGMSFKDDETNALVAPMARMALKGLSWFRPRSITPRTVSGTTIDHDWTPLPARLWR
jgi:hypothetical protein